MATRCVSFELIQDNLVENTESMFVRIQNDDGHITIDQTNDDIVTFSVEDSDSKSEYKYPWMKNDPDLLPQI